MVPVFVISIIFSVPIIAILATTYLKVKKLQAERGLSSAEQSALLKAIEKISKENTELKQRIENLEVIVTSNDWAAVNLPLHTKEQTISQEAEELAKILLRSKKG